MDSIRIENLTWPEIGKAIAGGFDTVVFALGSTEQHGPALPENTDTVQGDFIAASVAKKLGNTLQAPTMHLGCSDHHLAFPGTISLRKSTLQAVIEDYVASLVHHGFRTIIIIPFHGGNFTPTAEILPQMNEKHPETRILAFTNLVATASLIKAMSVKEGFKPEEIGAHADAWESSNMLYLAEESVKQENFAEGYTGPLGETEIKRLYEKGMKSLTLNGILGDSRRSDATYGPIFLNRMADFLVGKIKDRL